MKLKTLLLCGLLLCLTISAPVQAQESRIPLLMLIGNQYGDLWAWTAPDQPLKQMTNWGYNLNPVISPDGKYVAYDSVPQFAVPTECSGWPPFNIWLMEISSGNAKRIADQPPKASYCGNSRQFSFIRRPAPTWSPDSNFLAWGESFVYNDMPGDGHIPYRLVVYDVVRQKQRIIVDNLPGDQDITNGQPVDWSENGIVDTAFDFQHDPPITLNIYDPDGKSLLSTGFTGTPCYWDGVAGRWIHDGAKTVLAVCIDNQRYLVDLTTGKQSDLAGQIELYSLTAPTGLSFVDISDENGRTTWHLASDGQIVNAVDPIKTLYNDFGLNQLAISPDGKQAAFVTDKGLFVYDQNGQIAPIQLKDKQEVDWIGWGAIALRILK